MKHSPSLKSTKGHTTCLKNENDREGSNLEEKNCDVCLFNTIVKNLENTVAKVF